MNDMFHHIQIPATRGGFKKAARYQLYALFEIVVNLG